jgi:hypothetical protein
MLLCLSPFSTAIFIGRAENGEVDMNVKAYVRRYKSYFFLAPCCILLLVACGLPPVPNNENVLSEQALPGNAVACFYENINYQGASFCATVDNPSLNSQWNNRISSVKVKRNFKVELFNNPRFTGLGLSTTANVRNLGTGNFDNLASSFRVGDGGSVNAACNLDARVTRDVTGIDGTLNFRLIEIYDQALVMTNSRLACSTLYRKASEVGPVLTPVNLIYRNIPKVVSTGVDSRGVSIRFSALHLQTFIANTTNTLPLADEFNALVIQELANVYQRKDRDGGGADSGVLSGIASFVGLKNGMIPRGATPNKNGKWNDGGSTTGYFLLWLDQTYPDSVYKLNLSLDDNDGKKWTTQTFQTITGKTLAQLWQAYRNSN